MLSVPHGHGRRLAQTLIAILFFAAVVTVICGPYPSPVNAQGTVTPPPAWLEPRMMSIVDLVGFVPEETLQNAMLTYSTATGILYYVSGVRRYDEVEIHVRVTPRYFTSGPATYTQFGCLGQTPVYDQWPGATPASTMRLYSNDQEITPAIYWISIIPAGLVHPQSGSTAYYRYAFDAGKFVASGTKPLEIPANMGCTMVLPGRQEKLTAVFTMRSGASIRPTYLGTQSFDARSYIGVGAAGVLGPLNEQMNARFDDRHDKFTLAPPAGADYMLVTFPPTPLDPYAAVYPTNAGLEGSGTYRLERPFALSVDQVNSLAIPLIGHWLDVDRAAPSAFLPFYLDWPRLASPEYFLPPGVPFDPCMSNGGCPDSVLDAVAEARYPVNVHYFNVERNAGSDLLRIPLQQVGATWTPTPSDSAAESAMPAQGPDAGLQSNVIYLPWASRLLSGPLPPDDRTGCPYGCGWFDRIGRMLDFIPPP